MRFNASKSWHLPNQNCFFEGYVRNGSFSLIFLLFFSSLHDDDIKFVGVEQLMMIIIILVIRP